MNEQNGAHEQGEAQRFAEAIAIANIPVLLMVLVQLTGELRWLEEPYEIRRPRGMSDNDGGELAEPIEAEIRAAALEAILAWRAGRPVAIPEPSQELRLKMLSRAMAEEFPPNTTRSSPKSFLWGRTEPPRSCPFRTASRS